MFELLLDRIIRTNLNKLSDSSIEYNEIFYQLLDQNWQIMFTVNWLLICSFKQMKANTTYFIMQPIDHFPNP